MRTVDEQVRTIDGVLRTIDGVLRTVGERVRTIGTTTNAAGDPQVTGRVGRKSVRSDQKNAGRNVVAHDCLKSLSQ